MSAVSSDPKAPKALRASAAFPVKAALPALPEKTALPANADSKATEAIAATPAREGRLDRLVSQVLRVLAEAVALDRRVLPARPVHPVNQACRAQLESEVSAVNEVIWASAA